jgi:hypothetical protein
MIRRSLIPITVGLAVVVSVLLTVLLRGEASTTADLDPDNPHRNGARAVARVLEAEGVDVEVARSADQLEELTVDSATSVMVTSAEDLGLSTAERLLDHTTAGQLLVVEPTPGALDALGLELAAFQATPDGEVGASCTESLLAELRIEVDDAVVYDGAGEGCFPSGGGELYLEPEPGIAVLGAGQILANEQVTEADNAAAALRLLGQQDRLVWYVPDVADLEADDAVALSSLLPEGIFPALWLALTAVLALLLWRGRRLGRLVIEPLPVAVKAIETTQGRARLYRKVHDVDHAVAVLRTSARSRLAARLRLPRSLADQPEQLAHELARTSGRSPEEIHALIAQNAAVPTSAHDLIHLARQLAELEREVPHRP